MVAKDPFEMLGGQSEPVKPKKLKKAVTRSAASKDVEVSETNTEAKAKPKTRAKAKPKTKTKTKRASSSTKRRTRKPRTRKKQQVKKGSTITAKWFFIGCGMFFLIFL